MYLIRKEHFCKTLTKCVKGSHKKVQKSANGDESIFPGFQRPISCFYRIVISVELLNNFNNDLTFDNLQTINSCLKYGAAT